MEKLYKHSKNPILNLKFKKILFSKNSISLSLLTLKTRTLSYTKLKFPDTIIT